MSQSQPLLEMHQISKSFPGVQALSGVNLTVYPGEIIALVGENGAGKSTLMKILNGVYTADSGEILWEGRPVHIRSPHEAQALGISMIHQELALVPYLDAAKNILLGREPRGMIPGNVNWGALYREAQQQIDRLNLDINIRTPVRYLPIAQQQMIEVAKALSRNARLIVMDEPTSSLTDREVATLFSQMRALKAAGVAIVFISHRMSEIFEVCDRVVVLRDGQYVDSQPLIHIDTQDIIRMMVGRELTQIYEKPANSHIQPDIVLEVRGLSRGKRVRDVSFKLRRGEILGFAGLVGSGRTELVQTIFGAHPAQTGEILIEGERVHIHRPAQAIASGIGLVPEDRKREGLFLRMSVAANVAMASLRRMSRVFVQRGKVRDTAKRYIDELSIRTPSQVQRVRNLSGGNQQKVVIAKWLTLNPKVLILDEPTRGIDVGAKSEIYRLMHQLTAQGVSIIMISSELPEVMGVSDRILVMHEGHISGEFDSASVTQEQIMNAATGMHGKKGA